MVGKLSDKEFEKVAEDALSKLHQGGLCSRVFWKAVFLASGIPINDPKSAKRLLVKKAQKAELEIIELEKSLDVRTQGPK